MHFPQLHNTIHARTAKKSLDTAKRIMKIIYGHCPSRGSMTHIHIVHVAQFFFYFIPSCHILCCSSHILSRVCCTCFGVRIFVGLFCFWLGVFVACVCTLNVFTRTIHKASSPFLGKINFLLFSSQFDMHATQTTRK